MKRFLENKKVQNLLFYLIVIALALVLKPIINGVPLRGVPDWEEIDRIEISSEEHNNQVKVYSGKYECVIAHVLFEDARCCILPKKDLYTSNLITVTFHVGEEQYTGAICEDVVIWQGQIYALREEPEALIAAKTYYFSEDNE